MSGSVEALYIDVGNTRAKYCVERDGQLSDSYYLEHVEQLIEHVNVTSDVVIASVGQAEFTLKLIEGLTAAGISPMVLQSPGQQMGLTNGYVKPDKLGIDRWLAMLACRKLTSAPFMVLDAGSAITCDFVVADGRHIGGWILPGVSAVSTSLQQVTSHLPMVDCAVPPISAGDDTLSCLQHGQLGLWQGLIQQACTYMDTQVDDYRIFVTGGDADWLICRFNRFVEKIDQAVFKGMQLTLKG